MEELILWVALKYPKVGTALLIIGALRTINKPLGALIKAFIAWTPTKYDDDLLNHVERSRTYRIAVFVLNWLASIKLPKKR